LSFIGQTLEITLSSVTVWFPCCLWRGREGKYLSSNGSFIPRMQ